MLCSHAKKFIYLKTMKTAGTSTEIFFEQNCCPPSLYVKSHSRPELVTDVGIIGYRGGDISQSRYYHHMSASRVRDLLGEEIWQTYFKFCVIRNPYDKAVSMFWMQTPEADRARLANAHFSDVKEKFTDYVENAQTLPLDNHVYKIDGKVAVDFLIRFENLVEDIKTVCHHLGLDTPMGELGRYKGDYRLRSEHFSLYYDDRSEELIRNYFEWEIDYFQYAI